MKKAVFFDIDGTLWDSRNFIPESTGKAVEALRKNGHLTFICSGRTRAFIQSPALLGLGFDGIVSGCGTMIEYRGKELFLKELDPALVAFTVESVRSCGFRPILEGARYLYMDDDEFADDAYGKKVMRDCGGRLRSILGYWGKWEISKLSCATDHADRARCFAMLSEYYDYCIHNENVAEFLPKGYHKGSGIENLCELLDLDIADTYAFGDSVNDLSMFEAAGISVAMGSGSEEAKNAADYVTDSLYDDGIWNACRHFSLI